jgi:hypothetical protein
MGYTKKDVWNMFFNNFSIKNIMLGNIYFTKEKWYVLGLMMLPLPKKDSEYNKALYNFWSGCGDSKDYEFVQKTRQKLLHARGR